MSKGFDIASMVSMPEAVRNAVQMIELDRLVPYKNHCFKLYQGERLDDMVRSIINNGIIVPIIVRPILNSRKYEILSGHNRVYAAGLAGKKNVPAVVKENLSDEEAQVYVIETNLIQRGFKDLRISEQAFAVAMSYKRLFDSKKLREIKAELTYLETGKKEESESCPPEGECPLKGDGGNKRVEAITAEEYGIGHSTVARLLRINMLSDRFKAMVDDGRIKVRPAVELSFLSPELQERVCNILEASGIEAIDMKMAKAFRDIAESYSEPSDEAFDAVISGEETEVKEKEYKVSMTGATYTRYFKDIPKKEINGIIEKALEMYFAGVETA